MRRISIDERRARLARRHHLAAAASSPVDAARALVGLHSSDPVTPVLGSRARVRGFVVEDLERALYEARTLARVLGMRRTMFVLPLEQVPVVHGACTRALAGGERKRLVGWIQADGLAEDAAEWLEDVERRTLAALRQLGEATATELSAVVPELRERVVVGAGTRAATAVGMSTRVLFLLATDGRIVRGRPRGSWISTQYRWAPLDDVLGIDVDALETQSARTQLVTLWLRAFGPATVDDLRWWTGWSLRDTQRTLSGITTATVDLDGVAGLVLADDVDRVRPPGLWVKLLPALDPTSMGWKHRDFYLGGHRAAIFDRNGNAGPTVWCDGRIVGGWAHRTSGEVVVRLLEDIGADAGRLVDEEAAALSQWLGDIRFVPRFRTPLERELAA